MDQFNADERLWLKPEPKQRARRKLRLRLSRKPLKRLDLLELAKARPPARLARTTDSAVENLSPLNIWPQCRT